MERERRDCCDTYVGEPHEWDCEEALEADLPREEWPT